MKLSIQIVLLSLVAIFIAGCGETKEKRAWSFMPNMHDQESVRAQEPSHENPVFEERKGRSMRTPVAGTVPSNFTHYTTAKMDITQSAKDINPLPKSMDILKAGQRAYNIYCVVCHGERGAGDGHIIPNMQTPGKSHSGRTYNSIMQFPPPPPLYTERINDMPDGQLFNYISRGGAIMPKYDHLPVEMRWSIVHYLRVLHKANFATDAEAEEYKANQKQFEDPSASAVIHDWKDK